MKRSSKPHKTMPDMRGPRTLRAGLVAASAEKQVIFDDLEAGELLGQGAYGMVHRMTEKDTGQCRVMKTVIRPNGWDDERLKLEAEILSNLDHPHILRIFSWYEDLDSVNLVMEHCEGGELPKLVREGRKRGQVLPERWAATAMLQSLQALVYIHAKGVVHKDLKGQNLLLLHRTEDVKGNIFGLNPHVIVCDLGIAEICCRGIFGLRGNKVAGTPATMAPEVWKGSCSPKSDVWSMGCVMFELFTNRLPFEVVGNIQQAAQMQSTWLELHRKGPNWDKLKTANDAKDFCKQCLTYKESQRPTALDCLKHHWFIASGCHELSQEEIDSLCRSVANWRERSPMQRALCLKMAVGCTCISKFARLFSKFDEDCSGILERSEVVAAMMSLGIDRNTAKKTAAALDINNDNSCEYLEFVAACLSSLEEQFDELLRQEFRMLDRGSKGELNGKEISQLMDELAPVAAAHGLQLEDIDANGDGAISFDEFCGYFGRPGVEYKYAIPPASQNRSTIPMKQHIRIVGGTGTLEQSIEQIKRSMEWSMEKKSKRPQADVKPGAGGEAEAKAKPRGKSKNAAKRQASHRSPSSVASSYASEGESLSPEKKAIAKRKASKEIVGDPKEAEKTPEGVFAAASQKAKPKTAARSKTPRKSSKEAPLAAPVAAHKEEAAEAASTSEPIAAAKAAGSSEKPAESSKRVGDATEQVAGGDVAPTDVFGAAASCYDGAAPSGGSMAQEEDYGGLHVVFESELKPAIEASSRLSEGMVSKISDEGESILDLEGDEPAKELDINQMNQSVTFSVAHSSVASSEQAKVAQCACWFTGSAISCFAPHKRVVGAPPRKPSKISL
mmetsp:Transcript_68601/g.223165  ORF Transcript_68601/g.223165 Transcript_68601/m.223165 type:complete len:842 (+) Transcript_68601:167-2692(+)